MVDALIDIAAGTMAGIAQVAAGHPLDTLKVRLQTFSPSIYPSLRSCFQQTVGKEGLAGLYKGASSPIAGAMMMNAAGFLFYGQSVKIVRAARGGGSDLHAAALTNSELVVAAFLSANPALLVEHPYDLMKTQMQVQTDRTRSGACSGGGSRAAPRGVVEVARAIVQTNGVAGFYQGVVSNWLRLVPGRSVYFSSFEMTRAALARRRKRTNGATAPPTMWANFAAGCVAGGCAWTSTYPADVVRNRMAADALAVRERAYASTWECYRAVHREGAFFRGFGACLARAIPVNGCIFVVYVEVKNTLERGSKSE